jgi:hypothetical protein
MGKAPGQDKDCQSTGIDRECEIRTAQNLHNFALENADGYWARLTLVASDGDIFFRAISTLHTTPPQDFFGESTAHT